MSEKYTQPREYETYYDRIVTLLPAQKMDITPLKDDVMTISVTGGEGVMTIDEDHVRVVIAGDRVAQICNVICFIENNGLEPLTFERLYE